MSRDHQKNPGGKSATSHRRWNGDSSFWKQLSLRGMARRGGRLRERDAARLLDAPAASPAWWSDFLDLMRRFGVAVRADGIGLSTTAWGDEEAVSRSALRQWESVADSLPLVLAVVDRGGRVLVANRVVEDWDLGSATGVVGRSIDGLLHPACTDPGCYLHPFTARAVASLARGESVNCQSDDALLGRRLAIRVVPLNAATPRGKAESRGQGLLIVEDVGERNRQEESRIAGPDWRRAGAGGKVVALHRRGTPVGAAAAAANTDATGRLAAVCADLQCLVAAALPVQDLAAAATLRAALPELEQAVLRLRQQLAPSVGPQPVTVDTPTESRLLAETESGS